MDRERTEAKLYEVMQEIRALWPHGSFGVHFTKGHGYYITLHRGGTCIHSTIRNRPSISDALQKAAIEFPDERTAAERAVADAENDLRRKREALASLDQLQAAS